MNHRRVTRVFRSKCGIQFPEILIKAVRPISSAIHRSAITERHHGIPFFLEHGFKLTLHVKDSPLRCLATRYSIVPPESTAKNHAGRLWNNRQLPRKLPLCQFQDGRLAGTRTSRQNNLFQTTAPLVFLFLQFIIIHGGRRRPLNFKARAADHMN